MSKIDDYKDAVEKDRLLKQFITEENTTLISESIHSYDYDYRISFLFKSKVNPEKGTVRIPYHSDRIGQMIAGACSLLIEQIIELAVRLSKDDVEQKRCNAEDEAIEFIKSMGATEAAKGENVQENTTNAG